VAETITRRRPGKPEPPQPPSTLGDMVGRFPARRRKIVKRLAQADATIGELGERDPDRESAAEDASEAA
jgi:hypothetical protein